MPGPSTLFVLTHLILAKPLRVATVIIPILQVRKLRGTEKISIFLLVVLVSPTRYSSERQREAKLKLFYAWAPSVPIFKSSRQFSHISVMW